MVWHRAEVRLFAALRANFLKNAALLAGVLAGTFSAHDDFQSNSSGGPSPDPRLLPQCSIFLGPSGDPDAWAVLESLNYSSAGSQWLAVE